MAPPWLVDWLTTEFSCPTRWRGPGDVTDLAVQTFPSLRPLDSSYPRPTSAEPKTAYFETTIVRIAGLAMRGTQVPTVALRHSETGCS